MIDSKPGGATLIALPSLEAIGAMGTPKGNGKGAVLYARVSTDEQALEGVSLDAQRQRLEAYCQLKGLDPVAIIIDAAVSGAKPLAERDGGAQLSALLRAKKASHVVALKLDRLFRSTSNCLDTVALWDRAGVTLHLVDLGGSAIDTGSATGRFFLTVLAGIAELERGQIAERTAIALQHKASLGEYTGGAVPFGFRIGPDGVHLEPCEAEQTVIQLVRELRANGLSIRGIVAELQAKGIIGRTGNPLQLRQVARILEAA